MITLLDYYGIKKTQQEVEFVVPFLDIDRRFFLDPSLFRFSPNPFFNFWNKRIEKYVEIINKYLKRGNKQKLLELLNIGEAQDIGLGYCEEDGIGSGVGKEISSRTIDLLIGDEKYRRKGIERLEEIQWLDVNIGPDRISDLAGNILKSEIIRYTKKIAKKYKIPCSKVRVHKIFNFEREEWTMEEHVIPINEKRIVRDVMNPFPPILLVPRESVKMLPIFLDYNKYYGFIDPNYSKTNRRIYTKPKVRDITLENPDLSADFINKQEEKSERLYRPDFSTLGPELYEKLENIKEGQADANKYRDLVAEILGFVFDGHIELIGQEKTTLNKENRRDIIFSNISHEHPFSDFREKYSATNIVVETKNTSKVTADDMAQVSNYLHERIGMVGFIISRKKQGKIFQHQAAQVSNHKKIILHITDEDLKRWLKEKMRIQQTTGEKVEKYSPIKSLMEKYRNIEII